MSFADTKVCRKATILSFFCVLVAFGCGPTKKQKILVATASNVQFAVADIADAFYDNTGITVQIITGSSGKLSTQILQGAPFDLFISADMKFPLSLYRDGFATSPPESYAYGTVVIWTMAGHAPSLRDLLAKDVQHVAIPNPKTAPYGEMAIDALKNANMLEAIRDKLVYGANVGQVCQFVASGAAEYGLTAKSMIMSDHLKDEGNWADVPDDLYTSIKQGIVIVDQKEETKDGTEMFYAFMFSDIAREILEDNGYKLPQQ